VATRVLSDAEAEALATWAPEVSRSDLAAYFTLSVHDLRWVRSFRSPGLPPTGSAWPCNCPPCASWASSPPT